MSPGEFDGYGEFSPDYWSWPKPVVEVLGDAWHFSPKCWLTDDDHEVVRLWASAGGFDGLRHLPQAGGLLDQSALLSDAFRVVETTARAWRDVLHPK
jgi:hypothetical protein